jgi:hypothetical protein
VQAPGATAIVWLVLVPLILWRVYSRIRRMVGRQRLSKWRARITLILFPLLVAMLALAALTHPERLAILAVALAAGGALAVYGIRRTRFEAEPGKLYYTPNAHLGIALSLLFVGRIVVRFFEVFQGGAPSSGADFARSPLTLAVFGLLAGYYIGYAIGLLRYRAGVLRAKAAKSESSAAAMSETTQNRIPERDQPTSE